MLENTLKEFIFDCKMETTRFTDISAPKEAADLYLNIIRNALKTYEIHSPADTSLEEVSQICSVDYIDNSDIKDAYEELNIVGIAIGQANQRSYEGQKEAGIENRAPFYRTFAIDNAKRLSLDTAWRFFFKAITLAVHGLTNAEVDHYATAHLCGQYISLGYAYLYKQGVDVFLEEDDFQKSGLNSARQSEAFNSKLMRQKSTIEKYFSKELAKHPSHTLTSIRAYADELRSTASFLEEMKMHLGVDTGDELEKALLSKTALQQIAADLLRSKKRETATRNLDKFPHQK